jgi:hypothetical protein
MHPHQPSPGSFKRQVVFRIAADDWPLLEHAARQHGSIQAAVLAGLHALAQGRQRRTGDDQSAAEALATTAAPAGLATVCEAEDEEITAREAARILGLKADTVRGYIRSGRLPGHYNDTLGHSGWVTSWAAVAAYQQRLQVRR